MKPDPRFAGYRSYIWDTYVHYIEASGARVVPIIYNETTEAILDKVHKLDGVIFPGGDGDNLELGKIVFDEIIRLNDAGHFYPAWGTCLGYENMINYTASAGWDVLGHYPLDSASLALTFVKDPSQTTFYSLLGRNAFEFEHHNYTYNAHEWSLDPEKMESDAGLKDFWTLTAISHMPNNGSDPLPIVASIEAKNYPIFGTQYHPEKPSQLWVEGFDINHEWDSIEL